MILCGARTFSVLPLCRELLLVAPVSFIVVVGVVVSVLVANLRDGQISDQSEVNQFAQKLRKSQLGELNTCANK